MRATILPGIARGTVAAPPSKSMAHRLLIGAGLSKGTSVVHNVAMSQDILATLDCLAALGAVYQTEGDTVTVTGTDLTQAKGSGLPCRECGSTLRFMVPLCLLSGETFTLTGSPRLMERPMSVYETLCEKQGLTYRKEAGTITVAGRLTPGVYEIAGNISSQFITGLLFALPLLEEDSVIRLIPPVESRPYINMTLQALKPFGIEAHWNGESELIVPGCQTYRPAECCVEGDYSNAAFLEALNLCGGEVQVTGLDADSLQGDRVYMDHYNALRQGRAQIDLSDCPDLGPILFAAAALQYGADFTGTARLRIKESDRAACMQQELARFGAEVRVGDNTVSVHTGHLHTPAEELQGHNDHRIVMALAIAATRWGGTICGAQAITKSFPDFFEKLQELGLEVRIDGMDQ